MRVSAIAAITLISTNCCLAQERVIVTDTELRASYCLGVTTAQLETQSADVAKYRALARAKTATTEDRMKFSLAEDVEKIVRERRDRFREYLAAKGFLGGRSIREIKSALVRGPADVEACAATSADRDIEAKFKRQCGDASARCETQCTPGACLGIKRCLEQFLPF
jgi:hypothetical protein